MRTIISVTTHFHQIKVRDQHATIFSKRRVRVLPIFSIVIGLLCLTLLSAHTHAQDVSLTNPSHPFQNSGVLLQANTLAAPTTLPTSAPLIVPTESPTPMPTTAPLARLEDTFDSSPAMALFDHQSMTFMSVSGYGELTGRVNGGILPALYDALRARDFVAEFELLVPSTRTDSSYGLIFRSDDAAGGLAHFYLLAIRPLSHQVYFLGFQDNKFFRSERQVFDAALLANESNRVRVMALNTILQIYLNETLVYETSDSVLAAPGYFGLVSIPAQVPDVVRFDNLTIVSMDSGSVSPTQPATSLAPTALATMTLSRATSTNTATRVPTRIPPTPMPTSAGPCPNPLLNPFWADGFLDSQSGWTVVRGADYEHFYKGGEFHFAVMRQNYNGWAWKLFDDLGTRYAMQVRGWRLQEPEMNSYGLLFGGQDDLNYWAFQVSDMGSFRIAKHTTQGWQNLIPWTKSAVIQRGSSNTLKLIVDGTTLYACVNHKLVGTTNDSSLKVGRVGMIAGAYDEPVHIHFDDFALWQIQGPVSPPATNANVPSATSVPSSAPPGVYLTGLRTTNTNPKRNQDTSFTATFLNTTGAPQNLNWLVTIWEPDARKAFGETDVRSITVPIGSSEFVSASNWGVRGAGDCLSLYARAYFENPDTSRMPFQQTNGNDLTYGFKVCPE